MGFSKTGASTAPVHLDPGPQHAEARQVANPLGLVLSVCQELLQTVDHLSLLHLWRNANGVLQDLERKPHGVRNQRSTIGRQWLADIIYSGAVSVVWLTEVFRQAAKSRIIVNAHRINQGLLPEWSHDPTSDFHFVECTDPEDGVAKILHIVRERIPARYHLDPIRDIQVLSPMNRGGLGARSLNIDLQKALNPVGELRVERFGWTFAVGDNVMQVENDYDRDVYNGDLGVIRGIDPETSEMAIDFDGREVTHSFGELDEIVLAYATTIHKSQGSEYPAVVIPLTSQHYPMLRRNLLYTAVTRGKRLVVIVGQRKAMAIAVKGKQVGRRWSKLREWLESLD